MFDGVGKQDWYPSGESSFWGQYNRPYNQVPTWHLNNYWTEDNPNAYLPRYSGYYNPLYKGTANTRYLQDVSYIRLKTSSLGIIYQRNGLLKLVCPMFLFISPVRIYGRGHLSIAIRKIMM